MPNSTLNDILHGIGGDQGIAAGAADIIGAIKGTPQTVNNIQPPPPQPSGTQPILLIGGGLVLVLIMFMVLKK